MARRFNRFELIFLHKSAKSARKLKEQFVNLRILLEVNVIKFRGKIKNSTQIQQILADLPA
jgi:hypothetical protein